MRAPVPARGPQAEKEREGKEEGWWSESQRGSPRECNRRAFPIYRGPVPGKGRPERSSLGGFWACGPRSPPEGPKQRRRRRRERERKATGTPEAAEPESQRGSPRECNRRALPIYRGPVPGKGRPDRSRDWSRRVGGL